MFDFFDEDFPLSKKQEDELKRLQAKEEPEPAPEPESLKEQEAAQPADDDIVIESPAAESEDIVLESLNEDDADDGYENEPYEYVPTPAEEYEAQVNRIMSEPAEEVDEVYEEAEEDVPEAVEAADEEVEAADEEVEAGEPMGSYDEWGGFVQQEDNAPGETGGDITEKIASLDEIEAHLHEELKSLGEKLDSMEKVVDGMEDGEIKEGFEYEYDDRYFAEEETPAYKHPELYGKKNLPVSVDKKKQDKNININIKPSAIIKAGAAFAAAAVAIKLLSGGKKKR